MDDKYILFYDSGVGGLSTLSQTLDEVFGQKFIFFADDKNCPYGNKSKDEIYRLVKGNILHILDMFDIKIIVLACNTATACAVDKLRREINVPIVGIEPAIVPAMKKSRSSHILVLATCVTLSQEKYFKLSKSLSGKIESVKMPNLAVKIENHFIKDKRLNIKHEISQIWQILKDCPDIDSIVLGCTHYSFIKEKLSAFNIQIVDGNIGVAKRVKSLLNLSGENVLENKTQNKVKILLSSEDVYTLKWYTRLLLRISKNVIIE